MCGSGRLLIPLLKAGIKVDGLDYSSEMLSNCRERLKKENIRSTLYEQSIETIDLPQKYDAIIIAIGSLNISSRILITATSISPTSLFILAIISPFL